MVRMEDYRGTDGHIDWTALRKAEIAAGEKCPRCGTYMSNLWEVRNYEHLCSQCSSLDDNKEEISHDSIIRCPNCKESWDVGEGEDYQCYEDGEHDVCCSSCGHDFIVSTSVSYSFTSPALVEQENAEDKSETE